MYQCKSHLGLQRVKEHLSMICRVPIGLEDVSTYPNLYAELVDRDWSDEDLRKLAGKNLIQAFRKAEEVGNYIYFIDHCMK